MRTTGPKPWRDACEEVVRGHSARDAVRHWRLSYQMPDGEECPPFNYRFEHTLAVVKLARWLAGEVDADPDVTECAAWLHDCVKRLSGKRGKDNHAMAAAALVPRILRDTDFPPEKIPLVRTAIEQHVGLKLYQRLEPIEAACLWDADKLSKLGAASLAHFMCVSPSFQPVTTAMLLERGKRWTGLAETIVESMNTKPARKEAKRRLAFLTAYYAQLQREWRDPMEKSEK